MDRPVGGKAPLVLRAHHLLCIHGFRGMGYSAEFVATMARIVAAMRAPAPLPVRVVRGLDTACLSCPHHGETTCEASPTSEAHVLGIDDRVLARLDLVPGRVYEKAELIRRTRERVRPEDLDELCAGCSWLSYGVCQEGIARLRGGADRGASPGSTHRKGEREDDDVDGARG
ncbi:MAG: DUF1284 domain-containing protein [Hydrogenibacillus schlegelii]|nr:DUF1284 domain-containing protein [Hydrogenibacillus schlegelii]